MRRSLQNLSQNMAKKDNYPGLPKDLQEFNYYLADAGHCIMAIPECLLKEAENNGDLDMYEVPFPVKYVLENGCHMYKNHVICNAEYDSVLGLTIPDDYDEF